MASKRPEVGKFLFLISLPFASSTYQGQYSHGAVEQNMKSYLCILSDGSFSVSRGCTLYSSSLEQPVLVQHRCGKLNRVYTPKIKRRNSPQTNHHRIAYSILNSTMSTVPTLVVVEGREKIDARIDQNACASCKPSFWAHSLICVYLCHCYKSRS